MPPNRPGASQPHPQSDSAVHAMDLGVGVFINPPCCLSTPVPSRRSSELPGVSARRHTQGQGLSITRWPSLQKPVAVRGPPGTTLLSNLPTDSKVPTSSSPTPAPVLRIHQNDSLNSGKPYPYNYCFIMKTATREQPHRRALWGKGRGEGRGAFKPSPSVPRPAVNMVTHMEAPQTLSFKSCYPACISRRD